MNSHRDEETGGPGRRPQVDLRRLIGPLVGDVSRLLRRRFDRAAQPLGLTRAQWLCLGRVAGAPGITQQELAEIMDSAPITVSRILTRLERDGLIERRRDAGDRRLRRLYPTPAAAPLISRLFGLALALEEEALADLTEAERAALADMLRRVAARLSGQPPAAEPPREGGGC